MGFRIEKLVWHSCVRVGAGSESCVWKGLETAVHLKALEGEYSLACKILTFLLKSLALLIDLVGFL